MIENLKVFILRDLADSLRADRRHAGSGMHLGLTPLVNSGGGAEAMLGTARFEPHCRAPRSHVHVSVFVFIYCNNTWTLANPALIFSTIGTIGVCVPASASGILGIGYQESKVPLSSVTAEKSAHGLHVASGS